MGKLAIVLFEPEIPPNTGNVARTCAATGVELHLIEPLGFSIDDRAVKRAGLDYWRDVQVHVHSGWTDFSGYSASADFAFLSTRGMQPYSEIPVDESGTRYLVFGPETRGLPEDLLAENRHNTYRIPMRRGQRSLNLGNTVALVLYDQLARRGFPDLQ